MISCIRSIRIQLFYTLIVTPSGEVFFGCPVQNACLFYRGFCTGKTTLEIYIIFIFLYLNHTACLIKCFTILIGLDNGGVQAEC